MDETELESLVVRLSGDAGNYTQMLSEAAGSTEKTAADVETHSKQVEAFGSSLKGYAQAAVGALAALGATAFLGDALGKFQEAEEGEIKLRAALEANGRAVDSLLADYKQWASSIQDITTLDDDAVLALLKRAEAQGLTGESAKRAAQNAIAMEAAFDISAQGAIRMTVGLEQGRSEMLGRFIPALRAIKDPAERTAKAYEILGKGFGQATAAAGSSAGKLKQLKNAYDNLLEDFGASIADGIAPLVEGAKEAVRWFASLSAGTKETIVVVAGVTAGVIALTAAVVALGAVWNLMTGGVTLILGAIVTAAAAAAAWVAGMGGVKDAWAAVSERAKAWWDWFKPIGAELTIIWNGIAEVAAAAWKAISDAAVDVWNELTGGIDWKQIQQGIVDALIAAEYGVRNLGAVWDVAVTSAALSFQTWADDVLDFFSRLLPETIAGLPALLAGGEIEYSAKVVSDVQKTLRGDLERSAGVLAKDFAAFHRKRSDEISKAIAAVAGPQPRPEPKPQAQAGTGGGTGGGGAVAKLGGAVAFFSAEARSKVTDYTSALDGRRDEALAVAKESRDLLKEIRDKPDLGDLEAADF